jgi:hypothetical protein
MPDTIACTLGDRCFCPDVRECGNAYPNPLVDYEAEIDSLEPGELERIRQPGG